MVFQYTDEAAVDSFNVSCSICLETVSDNGDRSWAKLLCGHRFHLDCIGSAFNVKGAMQCPNCRKIEKGQWLYANGGCVFPEFNADVWTHEEDLDDFRYSEMALGVHLCPFTGLTRPPNSFNEAEFASNGYHDLLGQHAISMEHASVTSDSPHQCPYVAYVSPLNPSSSSSLGTTVSDGSNVSDHWTVNESPSSYALPSMDVHYHGWGYSRPNADVHVPRSASFVQPPQVGHSSGARGSTASSPMAPPYPGSNARARDRVQALQAYYQLPNNTSPSSRTPVTSHSSRRLSHRGRVPALSHQHQLGGFEYLPSSASSSSIHNSTESETTVPRSFHVLEGGQHQTTSSFSSNSLDTIRGRRFNAYRQRRASERASSHNRS